MPARAIICGFQIIINICEFPDQGIFERWFLPKKAYDWIVLVLPGLCGLGRQTLPSNRLLLTKDYVMCRLRVSDSPVRKYIHAGEGSPLMKPTRNIAEEIDDQRQWKH